MAIIINFFTILNVKSQDQKYYILVMQFLDWSPAKLRNYTTSE